MGEMKDWAQGFTSGNWKTNVKSAICAKLTLRRLNEHSLRIQKPNWNWQCNTNLDNIRKMIELGFDDLLRFHERRRRKLMKELRNNENYKYRFLMQFQYEPKTKIVLQSKYIIFMRAFYYL